MIEDKTFKKLSIYSIIVVLIVLTAIILKPLVTSIITGLLLSYIFYPVYKKINSKINLKNLSALIVVFLAICLLLIPLWFLLPILLRQIIDMYSYIQKLDLKLFIETLLPSFKYSSQSIANSFNVFLADITSKILSSSSKILLGLPNLVLKGVIVFFIFFFGLRDGESLVGYIKSLSPFSKELEQNLITKFHNMTNAVVYGYVVVGVIQGLLTGLGLIVFRVPQALIFTIIAVLAAMIPFLGAWLVWVPAGIYLIVSGNVFGGVALLIYGSIVISWIDNIIRPYIIAKKTKMPSAIALIGMIGGLIVFGVLGLIIGPLALAYLLVLLEEYKQKKNPVT